jgi:DNA replication and repair protein RecF
MYISRLALDHYRSWEHCVLDFKPGINILQGANGLGKTNIVEAIEVLSTGSSHRASSSLPLIEKGCTSATIRANVEDGETQHTYEATIVARGANRARIDGGKSQYMRDLIGRTPSVSFTPEDQRLVAGDPATRRNFINQAASLLLPHYAQTLQQFTHVAKQRTALLKQPAIRPAGGLKRAGNLDGAIHRPRHAADAGPQQRDLTLGRAFCADLRVFGGR